jgi:hypothetical protein
VSAQPFDAEKRARDLGQQSNWRVGMHELLRFAREAADARAEEIARKCDAEAVKAHARIAAEDSEFPCGLSQGFQRSANIARAAIAPSVTAECTASEAKADPMHAAHDWDDAAALERAAIVMGERGHPAAASVLDAEAGRLFAELDAPPPTREQRLEAALRSLIAHESMGHPSTCPCRCCHAGRTLDGG